MYQVVLCGLALISAVLMYQQSDYDLKFTRFEVVSFDKRFVRHANAVTFKYNRTQAAVNLSFDVLNDAGYELMMLVQAYKFASNEYRLFPVRFMFNFCDAIAKNDFGLGEMQKCGNFSRCPMKKGNYLVCNWVTNPSHYPPYVPNGDYKLEIAFVQQSMETMVCNYYASVTRKCCKWEKSNNSIIRKH